MKIRARCIHYEAHALDHHVNEFSKCQYDILPHPHTHTHTANKYMYSYSYSYNHNCDEDSDNDSNFNFNSNSNSNSNINSIMAETSMMPMAFCYLRHIDPPPPCPISISTSISTSTKVNLGIESELNSDSDSDPNTVSGSGLDSQSTSTSTSTLKSISNSLMEQLERKQHKYLGLSLNENAYVNNDEMNYESYIDTHTHADTDTDTCTHTHTHIHMGESLEEDAMDAKSHAELFTPKLLPHVRMDLPMQSQSLSQSQSQSIVMPMSMSTLDEVGMTSTSTSTSKMIMTTQQRRIHRICCSRWMNKDIDIDADADADTTGDRQWTTSVRRRQRQCECRQKHNQNQSENQDENQDQDQSLATNDNNEHGSIHTTNKSESSSSSGTLNSWMMWMMDRRYRYRSSSSSDNGRLARTTRNARTEAVMMEVMHRIMKRIHSLQGTCMDYYYEHKYEYECEYEYKYEHDDERTRESGRRRACSTTRRRSKGSGRRACTSHQTSSSSSSWLEDRKKRWRRDRFFRRCQRMVGERQIYNLYKQSNCTWNDDNDDGGGGGSDHDHHLFGRRGNGASTSTSSTFPPPIVVKKYNSIVNNVSCHLYIDPKMVDDNGDDERTLEGRQGQKAPVSVRVGGKLLVPDQYFVRALSLATVPTTRPTNTTSSSDNKKNKGKGHFSQASFVSHRSRLKKEDKGDKDKDKDTDGMSDEGLQLHSKSRSCPERNLSDDHDEKSTKDGTKSFSSILNKADHGSNIATFLQKNNRILKDVVVVVDSVLISGGGDKNDRKDTRTNKMKGVNGSRVRVVEGVDLILNPMQIVSDPPLPSQMVVINSRKRKKKDTSVTSTTSTSSMGCIQVQVPIYEGSCRLPLSVLKPRNKDKSSLMMSKRRRIRDSGAYGEITLPSVTRTQNSIRSPLPSTNGKHLRSISSVARPWSVNNGVYLPHVRDDGGDASKSLMNAIATIGKRLSMNLFRCNLIYCDRSAQCPPAPPPLHSKKRRSGRLHDISPFEFDTWKQSIADLEEEGRNVLGYESNINQDCPKTHHEKSLPTLIEEYEQDLCESVAITGEFLHLTIKSRDTTPKKQALSPTTEKPDDTQIQPLSPQTQKHDEPDTHVEHDDEIERGQTYCHTANQSIASFSPAECVKGKVDDREVATSDRKKEKEKERKRQERTEEKQAKRERKRQKKEQKKERKRQKKLAEKSRKRRNDASGVNADAVVDIPRITVPSLHVGVTPMVMTRKKYEVKTITEEVCLTTNATEVRQQEVQQYSTVGTRQEDTKQFTNIVDENGGHFGHREPSKSYSNRDPSNSYNTPRYGHHSLLRTDQMNSENTQKISNSRTEYPKDSRQDLYPNSSQIQHNQQYHRPREEPMIEYLDESPLLERNHRMETSSKFLANQSLAKAPHDKNTPRIEDERPPTRGKIDSNRNDTYNCMNNFSPKPSHFINSTDGHEYSDYHNSQSCDPDGHFEETQAVPKAPLLIPILCSEQFLENASQTAAELSSGRYWDCHESSRKNENSIDSVARAKFELFDCELIDSCGIDLELPGRVAIKIIFATRIFNPKECTKEIVGIASSSRYDSIHLLVVMDTNDTNYYLEELSILQNSLVKQRGCPCQKISFQYLSEKTLSFCIAHIIFSCPPHMNDNFSLSVESDLIERAKFLLGLIPSLTVYESMKLLQQQPNAPFKDMLLSFTNESDQMGLRQLNRIQIASCLSTSLSRFQVQPE